uniref:non-specific serine/threonine protein kinase n=1 Tax=Fagus sylvatica TaxID=28930 RepID=A0A2N9G7G3_FAGSY
MWDGWGLNSLLQTLPLSYTLDTLRGTSLSVDKPSDILVSTNGEYSAGFFPVGDNAFCFAIWFNKSLNSTVVWMANRDDPVDGKGSKLSLLKDGELILTNSIGITVWSTRTAALTSSDATNLQLQLQNTGNLVLNNSKGVIWQSFDSPIDTLLPQQALTLTSSLISRRSQGDYSSGKYKLFFDNDNVLRLLSQSPTMSSLYWPDPWFHNPEDAGRSMYNTSRHALLDDKGYFKSSDNFQFKATDFGVVTHRRLTLDPDGNLRLYSLQKMNGRWDWVVTWQAFSQPCRIHGICGPNSLCSYDHVTGRKCSCLQGFKLKYHTDWSYGCEPEFNISCNNTDESSFVQLAHVEYYGSDLDFPIGILALELLSRKITTKHPDPDLASQGYVLTTRFKRFTFDELRKATRGFKEVIGRGASGTVYKGVLLDKRVAAIKRLNEADQGEAEFLAEVNTIGMLNHMYLIEMWGYCVEGKHKLLVYEYMEHGSLAENLSSNALDWKKRFQIAVGTAKGLAYLHEECLEWILHCDIKPQNILLDDDYQPRVADFGLSKLLSRSKIDHLSFSRMRGTRGYMAPEWVYNLPITSKVDVYSYGISWIEDIIDPMMAGKYDKAKMELLVKVALQCVAEDKG